jgi:hypothetical protein
MHESLRKFGLIVFLLWISSCSSSNGLRKFDDSNLDQAASADLAKKFEVKDVSAETSPAPSPKPTPVPEVRKKKSKKKTTKKEIPVVAASTPAPSLPPSRRSEPFPFEVGENLEYSIRYVGVPAGYFNLRVMPLKQLNERKVYHFEADVKTVKLFELIYRVNDVVQSYADYDGLFSYKFTMDLDESKQNRKLIELYDYDKKKSFFWNRVDHVEKGFSERKENYDIELWSQDPISMFYYLRTAKLPTDPNVEVKIPVILDGKQWISVLHYMKTETIFSGGKNREARAYRMENTQNGEVKNKDNTLWISTDDKHYVLRIEAKVKIGTFAIALDKVL